MKQWETVDEILDFAIGQEEEAAAFYTLLAEQMARPWMKDVFLGFAKEEMGHKARLLAVKSGKMLLKVKDKVVDLKIGDYLVPVDPGPVKDYQSALIIAMKKEKAAFKLYTNLAAATDDAGIQETFLALAQEEAKHKLRFELEYDDYVLAEN